MKVGYITALTIYPSYLSALGVPPSLPIGPKPLAIQVQRAVRLPLFGTDKVHRRFLAYSPYPGDPPDLPDNFQPQRIPLYFSLTAGPPPAPPPAIQSRNRRPTPEADGPHGPHVPHDLEDAPHPVPRGLWELPCQCKALL
jgi:hypothetical protein